MADPVIMRRWTSRIRHEQRDAYVEYVRSTGVSDYRSTPGNLGFQMLLRDLPDGSTEVETISWWRSYDAIRAFAGEDYERARYYPQDDEFLLEKPSAVAHYEVVLSHGPMV